MLSSANRDLVARDRKLPGLGLLLDTPALLGLLRQRWTHLELSGLERTYLRYKPTTSCLAGFRLEVNGKATWLTFSARRRDARDKLEKSIIKTGQPGPFGSGRVLFPELALTMACFPNDRVLKRVRKIAGSKPPRTALSDLGFPKDATIVPLHYRPERRYVSRVEHLGTPIAVVKVHAPDAFARARVNAGAFLSCGPLVVPSLIGSSESLGAVACEWLYGSAAKFDPPTGRRIGEALAALHSETASDLAALTPECQSDSARAVAQDLGQLLPDLAERSKQLAARISSRLKQDTNPVPLHGDFHLDQVIDLGPKIGLVDFDEAARGPAEWDLGNMLAHLRLGGASEPDMAAFGAALLEGYRGAGGTVSEPALAAQTALALLRLSLRPFREQQIDWPHAVRAILDQADALCSSAASLRLADPALPQLSRALDPETANRAFAEAGLTDTVTSARLVRHKPGRRCLISYELRDASGRVYTAFGKLRAKGADSRTFALQQELWEQGFAPDGAAGARVSAPLALVPSLGLWLQAAVPGVPFAVETCTPELAAKAVGALHDAHIRPLKRHLLADELTILDARLEALAERRPAWSSRLGSLRQAAHMQAAQAQPVSLRPIHRDFYHDHLLRDGNVMHLIDLDLLCLGDPAVDIGNFNAHLTERALREYGDPDRFQKWQERFTGIACSSPQGARPANVRIYEFLSLVRLVEIADRMPERQPCCEALLMLCETKADAGPARFRRP